MLIPMGEKVAHNHPLRADLSSTKRLDRTAPICTLAAEPGAGMPKQRKKPAGQAAAATTMTAAEAVIATLVGHGLDTIYALPGVQNDFLFEALFGAQDRLRTVHTRHEQGAAYMALGAALATGKPAAYSVVPGPGFLNSTAALATAQSTGAKVLALIGQIPSRGIGKGRGYLHEIPDQLGIFRTLTKWAERVERPADAPGLVAQAFRQLASGRARPVGLELPPDMLAAQEEVELVSPLPPAPAAALDEDAIAQAAAALDAAQCPLIFVGGGALDASAEVQALAER